MYFYKKHPRTPRLMLFPMQQKKYMKHHQGMRGWAGAPWTANTPCLMWGHCDWPGMCEHGRAWARHGRSPILLSSALKNSLALYLVWAGWQIQRVPLRTRGGLEKSINMWEPLGHDWYRLEQAGVPDYSRVSLPVHPGGTQEHSMAGRVGDRYILS